jgi:monoamine oxidase
LLLIDNIERSAMNERFAVGGKERSGMWDSVIVGAGAAGLAAARALARAGARVVALEAGERTGGRVLWKHLPASDETVELGAEFIHGPAPETRELLRETGDRADDRDGDTWVCSPSGTLEIEEADFLDAGSIFDAVDALARDESVDAFLRRFADEGRIDPRAVDMARQFVEGFDAADPSRASVRGIAHEWKSGVDSVSARPSRGYAPLIERLQDGARDAGADLMLSTPVDSIEWSRDGVVVRAADGRIFPSRTVVVTTPAGVLREGHGPRFLPELPIEKRAAIERIESGDVVRIVMLFRTPFWEGVDGGRYGRAQFFRCPDSAFRAFWLQYPKRSRSVVAWAGGPAATRLRKMPREDLFKRAVTSFGSLFGRERVALDEFEDALMHDWTADPYARGAYSYLLVGGENARVELALPVGGRLFFAGEATANDGQGGTVNGAISTGVRAAREALVALGRTS